LAHRLHAKFNNTSTVHLDDENTGTDADVGGPAQPLLSVRGLTKHYALKGGLLTRSPGSVQAVTGVDFELRKGETLGIVGESGCGKSTTSRLIMALMRPTAGEIVLTGSPSGYRG